MEINFLQLNVSKNPEIKMQFNQLLLAVKCSHFLQHYIWQRLIHKLVGTKAASWYLLRQIKTERDKTEQLCGGRYKAFWLVLNKNSLSYKVFRSILISKINILSYLFSTNKINILREFEGYLLKCDRSMVVCVNECKYLQLNKN